MGLARATSGLPGLDRVLDDLRLGDNVVWQIDGVAERASCCQREQEYHEAFPKENIR